MSSMVANVADVTQRSWSTACTVASRVYSSISIPSFLRPGIPSLATCGWGALLVMMMASPFLYDRYYKHPRFVSVRHKIRKVLARSPLQLPLAGALAWVVVRVSYHAGFTSMIELIAIAAAINYAVRHQQKRDSALQLDVQQALQSPETCFAILGDRVPRWISFPNVQRATWLNTIITNLWPFVCDATHVVVKQQLAVTLAANKPPFLTTLALVNFTLGSAPVHIEGLQHHQNENKDTVLDMHLSWRSEDFEVRFQAGMSPLVVVEAAVTDFTFRIVARVILGPHLSAFPCVGASSVSILGAPDINFKLQAAKLSLDAIPGLSQWVDNFIRNILVAKMVFPKQLVFPIAKGFDITSQSSAFDHRAKALGRLRVAIHEATKITVGMMESNSFHVEIGYVDAAGEAMQKTAQHSIRKGLCSFDDQKFNFTIHDNTRQFGFFLYRDDVQRKKLVGQRTFTMAELMAAEKANVDLPLIHPKGKDCVAILQLSTKFTAFTSNVSNGQSLAAETSSNSPEAPPRAPPSRNSLARPTDAPVSRHPSSATPRQHSAMRESNSGLLLIRVENCKNLRNFEMVGISDPYVVLSVGNRSVKTPVVDDNLNPVFNFDAEMDIDDVTNGVLEIKVFDENMAKDVLMGKTTIPLIEVVRSNGQLAKETRGLSPQGTITLTLTLRMEG